MKRILTVAAVAVLCLLSIDAIAQEHEGYRKSPLKETLQSGDRAALLMVHFGTTYDETRTCTIDAINQKAREVFPEFEVREAYTSRIVIRRLKERGIEKLTPLDALFRLRAEGFTHIIMQPTTLLDGAEMESLRRDAATMSPFFREIRIGKPLLHDVEDSQKVASLLAARHLELVNPKKNHHVAFVGHGTYTPATAVYSQMDHIFKASGQGLFHVTTLEGYPTYDTLVAELKAAKARKVTLVPFLFVAGDHAGNDIAVEWKKNLEDEGFEVGCVLEGLGQIPEIQDIYISHIRFATEYSEVDIMKKKADYAAGR